MVYLLHASEKHAHAQHYIGYTQDKRTLQLRLEYHSNGNGSKFISRVNKKRKEQGKEPWVLVLVRLWKEGTKEDESRFKRWHKSPQLCPVCRGTVSIDELDRIDLYTGKIKA